MKAALKSYTIACLAVFVAAAQIAIMASVTSATVARADAAGGDTLMTLTPPEREPAAVWVGGTAAGLRVARVDDRRLVVTGSPYRIELRLPAKARRQTVGLAAARTALDALGAPYQWGSVGGRGTSGFDCSGLIWRAFASQGVTLPRVSREQARAGVAVPRTMVALEPGDLLAFSRVPGGRVEHVGLYVGAGKFVHSSGWDGAVVVSRLAPDDPRGRWWWQRWVGARRVVTSL